ncbi:hypothetical protein ACWGJ2_01895 [Streptomyces sp. NPDC054796]
MKRLVASAALVIATAGVGLSATAAQASATPGSGELSVVGSGNTAFAAIPAPAVKYGTYATKSECLSVGANGDAHGRWLKYWCYPGPNVWELWVQYS